MNTKGWSILLLAPVALSFSLLTACGNDDKKKSNSDSYYAGYWLSESAWASYDSTMGQEQAFCASLYKYPNYHGITIRSEKEEYSRVQYQALRVTAEGVVYHWTPAVRWGTNSSRGYEIGRLGPNGTFAAPPSDGRSAYRTRAMYANPYASFSPAMDGRIQASRFDGVTETYVRVTEVELKSYSALVVRCGRGQFRSVEWGYGFEENYGAMGPEFNPYYADQGGIPPEGVPPQRGPHGRPQMNEPLPEDRVPVK